jgi:hypothetical protein
VLALALFPLAVVLASRTSLPCRAWGLLVGAAVLAVVCKVAAEKLYRRRPEPQLRPDKPSHRVLTGQPDRVPAGW